MLELASTKILNKVVEKHGCLPYYKGSEKSKDITFGEVAFPNSILQFNNPRKAKHSTQKPTDLLEYLIKTYTLENETVLDFTMGSGSTGVAAKNLNREFIGIELDKNYFEIAKNRIESTLC